MMYDENDCVDRTVIEVLARQNIEQILSGQGDYLISATRRMIIKYDLCHHYLVVLDKVECEGVVYYA